MNQQHAPYGTWQSPLTAEMMRGSRPFGDAQFDHSGAYLVWQERRGKLGVLMAQVGTDAPYELTDERTPVSGRVGYGGGEFGVGDGFVIFTSNHRLYRVDLPQGLPYPITPAFGDAAAPVVSADGAWVAYVHSDEGVDRLLVVDSMGKTLPRIVAEGSDFFMFPTWHPKGTHLAYVAWQHPHMPWNETALMVATLAYDKQGAPYAAITETLVSGPNVAITQPQFSPDGRYLAYVSDASQWGHLVLHDLAEGTDTRLTSGTCEHGTPAWVQGTRTFAWQHDSQSLLAIRSENAFAALWHYDLAGKGVPVAHLNSYSAFERVACHPQRAAYAAIAAASVIPPRLITGDLGEPPRVVRRAAHERLAPHWLSQAQAITWQGHDGQTVHGLYSPPHNPRYESSGQPPLMVLVHGGPTSQADTTYNEQVQFFTTRGWAVLQVNHRGSTGYGKPYMDKHAGNWGVYDVEDSVTGAQHLAAQGLADAARMVIMGSSAGGFTVLLTLIRHPQVFRCGVSLYGVSNLFMLALDTHKFEARYNDWLLGALPEASPVWRERSAVFHADRIRTPLMLFQGLEDDIVPPSQSEAIVSALKRSGVPHAYITYAGEGHGFRAPETLKDLYTQLERFLLQHVIYGS